jgi:hypothetical protein
MLTDCDSKMLRNAKDNRFLPCPEMKKLKLAVRKRLLLAPLYARAPSVPLAVSFSCGELFVFLPLKGDIENGICQFGNRNKDQSGRYNC